MGEPVENRPPSVLVGSAMYNLSALSHKICDFIEGLGWKAVMSDRDLFLTGTNEKAAQDNLSILRENSDLLVMIVGARHGPSNLETDQRVATPEFSEARNGNSPVCVFVDSQVLAQLDVWRNNPDADFAHVVDTPQIFQFVDSFLGSREVWTFPFSTEDEIIDMLRQHLAHLVQDTLRLRQTAHNQDRLLEELRGDAPQIALRRDSYWEYRLFGAVLRDELDRRMPLRREIEHRLTRADVTYVDLGELAEWMFDRFHEYEGLGRSAKSILDNYLPQALGEPGMPGNPIEIAACARRLAQVWEDSARWTLRCRSSRVDERAERLVDLLSNTNANLLDEIWDFGHEFSNRFDRAVNESADEDPIVIKMNLSLTADLDDFYEEFAQFEESIDGKL